LKNILRSNGSPRAQASEDEAVFDETLKRIATAKGKQQDTSNKQ